MKIIKIIRTKTKCDAISDLDYAKFGQDLHKEFAAVFGKPARFFKQATVKYMNFGTSANLDDFEEPRISVYAERKGKTKVYLRVAVMAGAPGKTKALYEKEMTSSDLVDILQNAKQFLRQAKTKM